MSSLPPTNGRIVDGWEKTVDLSEDLQQKLIDDTLDHWLNAKNEEEQGGGGPLGAGEVDMGAGEDYRLHLELEVVVRGLGDFTPDILAASLDGLDNQVLDRYAHRPLFEIGIPIDLAVHITDLQWDGEDEGALLAHGGQIAWREEPRLITRVGLGVVQFSTCLAKIAGVDPLRSDDVVGAARAGAETLWRAIEATSLLVKRIAID